MINTRKQTKFWLFKDRFWKFLLVLLANFLQLKMLCYDFIPFKKICKKKQGCSQVKEKQPSKLLQKLNQGGLKLGYFANPAMGLMQSCLNL